MEALIRHYTGVEDFEKTELGELLRDYGWIGELDGDRLTVAINKNPPRVTHTVL
jgi:aminoglycoside phosphotransferase (APT) family kinase protein